MIVVRHKDGISTIVIDRPQKANSLTEKMLEQLIAAISEAKNAKAVVLSGAGKVFSAGADLDEAKRGLAISPLWEALSSAVEKLSGLTICALNGTLAGGAFGMALACDIRIAVPNARFFYPVMRHGFLPQPSDPVRMARLIGPARTKLILLAGQKLTSDEAFSFGLIDKIVPSNELDSAVDNLLQDVKVAKLETVIAIKTCCGRM